ncbi:GNAT family N-acetyltransferase [Streptomyces sp. NPDC048506]|uniref:GNAT family N-acetyltransferase n=1 Tax=Streptomyces sp. NPDC048506 TaxID=3155028 RepID=UPI0034333658
MTDQPGSGAITITLAAKGDGQAAATLGALAVSDHTPSPQAALSPLLHAIDNHGGRVPLPYGHGHCLTARLGDTIVGMLYAAPPIRWLQSQPADQRARLTQTLVEIELLAVAKPYRNRGIGTALLEGAEHAARAAGTHLALAKIRIGAFPTMRWYRQRGYTIAAQGEPIIFRTHQGFTSCDDGSDGHQLAVKTLQPGTSVHRDAARGDTCLIAEHTTQPNATRHP